MRFRKKPVVIEAVQWGGENDEGWPVGPNDPHPEDWIAATNLFRLGQDERGVFLVIPTLEGEMQARDGDWIVRGVKGEFYPCKPDIFEMTYEPADRNAAQPPTERESP